MRILTLGTIAAAVVFASITVVITAQGRSPREETCVFWNEIVAYERRINLDADAPWRTGYSYGVMSAIGVGPKIQRALAVGEVTAAINARCVREPNTRIIVVARWALGW